MKRVFLIATSMVAVSALLVSSPAQAATPVDGTYACLTGEPSAGTPNYTITSGAVLAGSNCVGAVVIPSGVTSIGANAFQWSAMESITIPEGVTVIGDDAFDGTPNLTSMTIPASVTELKNRVFGYSKISSVFFAPGSQLTVIGDEAFTRTENLTSMTIPASVTELKNNVFTYSNISSVIFSPGSQLRVIGSTFYRADNLSSLVIPDGVTSIGPDAFAGTALTSIDIPSGVEWIGPYAFAGTALTSIDIPSGVTYLGTGAFAYSGISTIALPSGLQSISAEMFFSSQLTSVTIPAGVTSIGPRAFAATKLTSVTIPSGVTAISTELFLETSTLTSVSMPSGVESIGSDAFAGTGLTSIDIPSSVTTIGSGAFYGTKLTSVTIPSSVTTLEPDTFRSAKDLSEIVFADNSQLTSIGAGVFMFAESLTSITIPAGVTSIGSSAFKVASSLARVNFLGNAPTVGENAFLSIGPSAQGYKTPSATGFSSPLGGLSILNYPTVTFDANGGSGGSSAWFIVGGSVDEPANPTRTGFGFAGWSESDGGSAVSFPFSPPGDVDLRLFALWTLETFGCASGLPSADGPTYRIVAGVVSEGSDCVGAVVIPSGVTTIAPSAFAYSQLSSITFPEGLTSIGLRAFWNSSLVSVEIPHSVTQIKESAFESSRSLEAVTFAAGSQLTSIERFSFSDTRKLTSITIPAGVTSIGDEAFLDASSLARVNFLGNAPTVGQNAFAIGPSAKGYKTPSATGFSSPLGGLSMLDYPTVTFDANDGSGGSSTWFIIGDSILGPTQPARAGYSFDGWFVARSGGSAIVFPFAHGQISDFTVYAQWTANSLTVTFDSQEGSSVSAGSTVTGESISPPGSPARAGYSFDGWFVARSGGSAIVFPFAHGQTSDFTVYAQWSVSPPAESVSPPAESVSPPAESVSPPAESVINALPSATLSTSLMVLGGKTTASYAGFTPGESVLLVVASTPRVIGTGVANTAGSVTITGEIPSTIGAGKHTLALYAPISGVGFRQVVTVSAAMLPSVGSNSTSPLGLGVLMLLSGAVLTAIRRRGVPNDY